MIAPKVFAGVALRGGFEIVSIEFTHTPFADALGRDAVAQTSIVGKQLRLLIKSGLAQREMSVTLYHEVLEAATVGADDPPASVLDFNEGDFERAAHAAHDSLGEATPERLNLMLQSYGFGEE